MSPSSRAVVVQHLDVEGPARIADALAAAGVTVDVVRPDLGDALPDRIDGIDALVVMGGPMSARSDDGFPSRQEELALLRAAITAQVPVLGVCLGAQLLAAAGGGAVHAGHGPEIGWAPITLLPAAATDRLFAGFGGPVDVLHWHGETYDLPPGATHLACSAAYEQQAFRVGERAWGLQFHLEVDAAEVDRFVDAFPDDAAQAPGGAVALRDATERALDELGPRRDALLARFASLVVSA